MKPPNDSSSAPRASEAFLRSARDDHAPSSADRERVRRALAQRLANATSTPVPNVSVRDASQTRAAISSLAKAGIGLVIVAAGSFAVLRTNDTPKQVNATPNVVAPRAPQAELAVERAPLPPVAATDTEDAAPRVAATRTRERSVPSRTKSAPRVSASTSITEKRAVEPEPTPTPAANSGSAELRPTAAREERQEPVATQQAAATSQVARSSTSASAPAPSEQKRVEPRVTQAQAAPAQAAQTQAQVIDVSTDARAELAFVQRIRSALTEADPERVLSLCDEHQRRWPHGTFAQEREGLQTIATCQTQAQNAASIARAFFASYPHSPMGPRVRIACASQLKAADKAR